MKTKKISKAFQRKNITFFTLFLNIYTGLGLFHLCYTYQLNSQSIGPPDKQRVARDSLFVE